MPKSGARQIKWVNRPFSILMAAFALPLNINQRQGW